MQRATHENFLCCARCSLPILVVTDAPVATVVARKDDDSQQQTSFESTVKKFVASSTTPEKKDSFQCQDVTDEVEETFEADYDASRTVFESVVKQHFADDAQLWKFSLPEGYAFDNPYPFEETKGTVYSAYLLTRSHVPGKKQKFAFTIQIDWPTCTWWICYHPHGLYYSDDRRDEFFVKVGVPCVHG